MWTHYIYGVGIVRFGMERNELYKRVTELAVLACLWLHPGILLYQLWVDRQMLPPNSLAQYVGQANMVLIAGAFVAWLTFLSYDILIRFKKRALWKKHWWWVSLSQGLAIGIIYLHAISFGRHIQVTWFKAYWLFIGLLLVPSVAYLLWVELPHTSKIKGGIIAIMKNTKLVVLIGVIGLMMLAVAGYIMSQQEETGATQSQPAVSSSQTTSNASVQSESAITLAQVEQNNGKNGAKCWVIVDTTVYEISGFAQWVDGVHTSSGGQARCGKDETDVIGDSPHGRTVLKLLTVVGTYQP